MEHTLNVTLTDSGISLVNPLRDVARGDTVIWIIPEGQGLQIALRPRHPFEGELSQRRNLPNFLETRGRISSRVKGKARFSYEIERDGQTLLINNHGTGAIIIKDPPDR